MEALLSLCDAREKGQRLQHAWMAISVSARNATIHPSVNDTICTSLCRSWEPDAGVLPILCSYIKPAVKNKMNKDAILQVFWSLKFDAKAHVHTDELSAIKSSPGPHSTAPMCTGG
jgi:hypothetical protein